MKTSLSFLLFAALVAIVFAVDLKPTADIPSVSNVVCAMTVCPTATLSKRELACPSICKDDCKIIDDQCCPGVQKAICNKSAPSSNLPSSATPSATASGSIVPTGSPLPSSSSISASSSFSAPAPPASSQSSTPGAARPNQADSNKAVLSTILVMALISVTLLI